jgi:uncharacterized protein
MLNDPLPKQVDVRKLINKSAEITAQEPVAQLQRLASVLADDGGSVTVNLAFYIDEGRFRKIDGDINTEVSVICQRCLEPMKVSLEANVNLAVVWTEDEAKQLPRDLDPLIVGEEPINLADIVEEELILSLPIVSYHSEDQCKGHSSFVSGDEEVVADEPKENPFSVLEQLKSKDT